MSDDLLKKIGEWLEKNGYPLEYETQHVLDQAGLSCLQGYHVKDPKTGAIREIDVLAAHMRETEGGTVIRCLHVVECKQNGRPWLAFTRPIGLRGWHCIEQTIGNDAGRSALKAWSEDRELRTLELFRQREASAFSGTEVKLGDSNPRDPNARDGCYSALQQVVSTSAAVAAEVESDSLITVAFPVIVLGGPLYTASYDMKGRNMVVAEADEVRFHWQGAEALDAAHATIDVVTAKHLPTWAAQRRKDVDFLVKRLVMTAAKTGR